MNSRGIIATFIALLLSSLIILAGMQPYSIYGKIFGISSFKGTPKELYKVYLAGKELGIINSKAELESYIDSKQQELKDRYKVKKVYAPSDLKIMKEITYDTKTSSVEDIYKKIEEIKGPSSFTIDGYKITVAEKESKQESGTVTKEKEVIYVLNKKIFNAAVRATINAFIDSETYDNYLNDTQEEIPENEEGTYIDNIYFDNDIKISKERIPAGDNIYTDEIELSKLLLFGNTEEQDTYTVASGDTIASIANNNKLSVDEFLIANNEFKSATDLLYEGQVVKLASVSPKFDLTEIETVASKRPIYKSTVYKDDSNQYVGYEKVEDEGSDGLALVTEKKEIVNGEIMDSIQISKQELVPAVNKVIVRGTKQYQTYSTGTEFVIPVGMGSWVWPTNSPYSINSPYGWRGYKLHEGVDIGGTGYGSPIKAANNGVVIQSGYTGTNGNYIVIQHPNSYYTMYAHLASRSKQVGDVVMAGDQIGTMGMSGYATGVHLHFAIYQGGAPYRGGVPINPFGAIYSR